MRAFFWAAWLGLCSTPLLAAPLQGFSFAQKDWELACDNTGACRAAGYGVRMGEVSVLLTRNAGSEQHLTATVTFAQIEHDIPADSAASLLIDDRDFGALDALDDSHFRLDSDQTTALLHALTNQRKIEFTLNGQKLLPILTPLLNQHCDDWQNQAIPAADRQITLTALDKTHSLAQALCWRAPYNDGYALWLVDNAQLSKPRLLTTEASSYADGAIVFLHKERGMADCVTGETRVWDGKTFTPSLKYSTGMCREITPGGTWMLPTFVSQVIPRQQKEADNLALRTLYNAVMKAQKSDPELSLNKVAEQFPLTGHITDFTLTYADDTLITTSKPSPDISDDEWQAFLRSSISADSENGKVSFTLIDLDGDGKRDLIIDSYVGGTGLFSYTGVLKRGDDDFAAVNGSDSDNGDDFDAGVPGALFSINGRGANQWNHWVQINGQVYALWYNGQFGEDNLYLLRPFSTTSQTPAVTVRYRYTLNSIRSPEKDQPLTPSLSDGDKADLLRSLEVMQGSLLKDRPASDNDAPICPIPPGTSADEADNYYSGVAVNYIYETVAYIPVWLNGKCYIGTIFSHHGAYRHGVDAEITLSSPREDEEVIGDYLISGLRHVIAITSGWKTREGDNGMQ